MIFCHWAWFRLVAILPAAVAAIGTLGIPIVGLFTSALVLGEPVGWAEVVALVLVVAGLGILVRGLTAAAPESLAEPRPSQEQEGVEMSPSPPRHPVRRSAAPGSDPDGMRRAPPPPDRRPGRAASPANDQLFAIRWALQREPPSCGRRGG